MKLLVDFVLVTGIIITMIILFILIKSARKQLPKQILIIFFSFLLLVAINAYAILHGIRTLYLITTLFDDIVIVLVGPLLFLYIKSLFLDNNSVIRQNLVHFVPVLIHFLLVPLPLFLSDILERPIFDYLPYLTDNIPIVVLFCDLYLILYLIFSLQLFVKYRSSMKMNYSNLNERDFGWVRKMLIGSLIVIGCDLVFLIMESSVNWFRINQNIDLTVLAMIVFIGYLGYYGMNQSRVLLPDFVIREELLNSNIKQKVNHLSSLKPGEIERMKSRLKTILLSQEPYLDEDLTLGKLARMLPTTDKKLSTLLNQEMHTTFYDLINKHRVNAVKEKLNSAELGHLTLLGIAFESGFKSKTSFNRIFKKQTGLSPSEYKKKL